jgi:thioredoxin-related protein
MQTEEQQKELLKIADENKVLQLPTLVIKDSKGTIVKSIEGPFESSEVAKVLDEVIKK